MASGVTLKRSIDLDGLHSPEHGIKRRRTSNVCHHSPYQPAASGFAPQPPQREKSPTISEFANCKISTEELYVAIRNELHRRRALNGNCRVSPSSSPSNSTVSSGSFSAMTTDDHPLTAELPSVVVSNSFDNLREKPFFTFKQVQTICERLLKEQEARLCAEYDKILNAKLAEQYDSFVRFTYDQIHRRLEDTPMSYLS